MVAHDVLIENIILDQRMYYTTIDYDVAGVENAQGSWDWICSCLS